MDIQLLISETIGPAIGKLDQFRAEHIAVKSGWNVPIRGR